jgi:hypothetical protein
MITNSETVRIKRYRKGKKELRKKKGGIWWKKRKMISPVNSSGRRLHGSYYKILYFKKSERINICLFLLLLALLSATG